MTAYAPSRRTAPGPQFTQTDFKPAIAASAASIVFGLGMLILRSTAGVRSIPERLMEWLLLFVPPGLFEAILQRVGFDAKRYALNVAILLVLAGVGWLGYEGLLRRWSIATLAGLGTGVWLLIMLVIMPLTSAGPFASALVEGATANVLGYLAICLSYSAVLIAGRLWIRFRTVADLPRRIATVPQPERRVALATIGGALAAYAATYASGLLSPNANRAPSILLVDPQEPVPSGGLDAPNPHPQAIAAPIAQATAASASGDLRPTRVASAAPALPMPAANRELPRDKDGAVMPAGRPAGQLASLITSNADFYIVTKNAGGDPALRPEDWRLLVDGDVERTFQLDYATLRRLPSVTVSKTLECISNFVGKPELASFGAELISAAQWRGVPVRDILGLTGGPKQSAAWLAVLSADEFTSAIPMEVAMDPGTLLVYEMNGDVLPYEHGYPARLLVPGRYGMKNAKWVIGLRPMSREFLDWYGQRNWSKDAVVRTMARIDSPAPGAGLDPGTATIAGVAYAGSRGIQRVEFSVDGGQGWQDAEVLGPPSPGQDLWVRWRGTFPYSPGDKVALLARATDGTGALQEQAFSLPEPDGGTGWPHLELG